jgi:transcriptional regulator with XRE-family HTH domain
MSHDSDTLGFRIKKKLKEKRMSSRALARLIDVSASSLNDIINNRVNPGLSKIALIAHHLEEDLNWIITGMSYEERMKKKQNDTINWIISERKSYYDTEKTAKIMRRLLELDPEHLEVINDMIETFLKKEGKE